MLLGTLLLTMLGQSRFDTTSKCPSDPPCGLTDLTESPFDRRIAWFFCVCRLAILAEMESVCVYARQSSYIEILKSKYFVRNQKAGSN